MLGSLTVLVDNNRKSGKVPKGGLYFHDELLGGDALIKKEALELIQKENKLLEREQKRRPTAKSTKSPKSASVSRKGVSFKELDDGRCVVMCERARPFLIVHPHRLSHSFAQRL